MDREQDKTLSPELLELIADRFKALAEPVRLQILNALRTGEKSVTELMDDTGLKQANLSKHLQVLYEKGFVVRRKAGLYVYYRLADPAVFLLCDIMCGRLRAETDERESVLAHRFPLPHEPNAPR